MKRTNLFTLLLLLNVFALLTSCGENEDNSNNLKIYNSTNITKKELKNYFNSKGIDITFEKPKYLNEKKIILKPLKFKTIQELDTYLNTINKIYNNQAESEQDVLTHHYPDDLGGSFEEGPTFYRHKTRIGGVFSSIYLNISFIKDKCEPRNLTSWITGNAYSSTYTEMSSYLTKGTSFGNSPVTVPIYYGVIGTLTTQVEVAGIIAYNTVNANSTGTHYCKK
ncbi:MAG: hypothetical protein JXQ93_10480 [Flavobacteriaceae bacterium]